MKRIGSLRWADWMLLAQAGVVVLACRVALWTMGVRGARKVVRLMAGGIRLKADPTSAARAPWAVRAAGRRIPGATCLTQALALQAMLERAGRPCRVEIGVAKAESFEAHAWLVCGDAVLLGDAGAARFQRVVSLD